MAETDNEKRWTVDSGSTATWPKVTERQNVEWSERWGEGPPPLTKSRKVSRLCSVGYEIPSKTYRNISYRCKSLTDITQTCRVGYGKLTENRTDNRVGFQGRTRTPGTSNYSVQNPHKLSGRVWKLLRRPCPQPGQEHIRAPGDGTGRLQN